MKAHIKWQSAAIHLHRTPAGYYQHLLQTQANLQELLDAPKIITLTPHRLHHHTIAGFAGFSEHEQWEEPIVIVEVNKTKNYFFFFNAETPRSPWQEVGLCMRDKKKKKGTVPAKVRNPFSLQLNPSDWKDFLPPFCFAKFPRQVVSAAYTPTRRSKHENTTGYAHNEFGLLSVFHTTWS